MFSRTVASKSGRSLPDDGDTRPPASEVDVVERHAVDRDRARRRPQQAEQELHDRRLARARAPDERRRDAGAQAGTTRPRAPPRPRVGVAERHAVEADLVRRRARPPRVLPRRPRASRADPSPRPSARRQPQAHARAVELLHLRAAGDRGAPGTSARPGGSSPGTPARTHGTAEHQRRDESSDAGGTSACTRWSRSNTRRSPSELAAKRRHFAGLATEHADRPPRAQHLDDPLRHASPRACLRAAERLDPPRRELRGRGHRHERQHDGRT